MAGKSVTWVLFFFTYYGRVILTCSLLEFWFITGGRCSIHTEVQPLGGYAWKHKICDMAWLGNLYCTCGCFFSKKCYLWVKSGQSLWEKVTQSQFTSKALLWGCYSLGHHHCKIVCSMCVWHISYAIWQSCYHSILSTLRRFTFKQPLHEIPNSSLTHQLFSSSWMRWSIIWAN